MGSVGRAIRECRMDAKPKKITQQKVAEELHRAISYVRIIESDDEMIVNFSDNDIRILFHLFRTNRVSEQKISEFLKACNNDRIAVRGDYG